MKKAISEKAAEHRIALLALVGAGILGLAQTVGAFSSDGGFGGVCAYSVQLQQSVSVRRDYLVKIDQVRGSNFLANNAIEEMYDNVVPASLSDDEDPGIGSISLLFGSSSKKTARSMGEFDAFSIDCLACHDGVAASAIGVDYRDNAFDRRSRVTSSKSDHPIGMTYASYVATGRGYKNVGSSTRMIFVNGKVGCLTCHDPLNPEKGHLVMSDVKSALCMTCHDK